MRFKALPPVGVALVMFAGMAFLAQGNYLTNPDFGVDLSGWHGDGELAYLKSDGTEGAQTDSDAVPVIKIALTHGQSRYVSQELDMTDKPNDMQVQVDVYASSDFQRSKFASDYTSTQSYQRMWDFQMDVFDTDFWIRIGPSDGFSEWESGTTDLKPGQWKTLKLQWPKGEKPGEHFTVYFCAPPGDGTIYLKNPVADK